MSVEEATKPEYVETVQRVIVPEDIEAVLRELLEYGYDALKEADKEDGKFFKDTSKMEYYKGRAAGAWEAKQIIERLLDFEERW